MKKNKLINIVIALLIIGATGYGIYRLIHHSKSQTKAPLSSRALTEDVSRAALTVTTVHPSFMTLPNLTTISGTTAPWQEASVSPSTYGKITRYYAEVGQNVKKGQLLAQLDDDMIQAEINQLNTNYDEAKIYLAEANDNALRVAPLENTGAMSVQQISQIKMNAKVAKAKIKTIEAGLKTQKMRLGYTKIYAPVGGQVLLRHWGIGTFVQPGQEMFRLMQDNKVEWRAEIPPEKAEQVSVGAKVEINLAGAKAGEMKSLPDIIQGQVYKIGPGVSFDKQMATAFVNLSSQRGIKPGMFLSGSLKLDDSQVLSLPASAVISKDGNAYAYKVDEHQKVQETKLTIGRRYQDRVEIIEGVSEADTIVSDGASFLTDGDIVHIVQTSESNEQLDSDLKAVASSALKTIAPNAVPIPATGVTVTTVDTHHTPPSHRLTPAATPPVQGAGVVRGSIIQQEPRKGEDL